MQFVLLMVLQVLRENWPQETSGYITTTKSRGSKKHICVVVFQKKNLQERYVKEQQLWRWIDLGKNIRIDTPSVA
jgi:hypothetical protein